MTATAHPVPTPGAPTPGRPGRILPAALVLAAACLATLPLGHALPRPGLDASYVWALNAAAGQGLLFGRDLLFTYGPLGYLMFPLPLADNIRHALAAALLLGVLETALLVHLALTRLSLPRALVLAAAVAALPARLETHVLFLSVLLATLALGRDRLAPLCAALSGALASCALCVKFSEGIAAAGTILALLLVLAATDRSRIVRTLAPCGAAAALTLLGLGLTLFGGLDNLARYLWWQGEFARGYAAAMSLAGPPAYPLWLAGACLAAFALAHLLPVRREPESLGGWICLPALFVTFKHGFVRQDLIHVLSFFAGFTAVCAARLPLARGRRGLALALAPLLLGLAVLAGLGWRSTYRPSFERSLGGAVVRDLRQALQAAASPPAPEESPALQRDRLPPEFAAPVRAVGTGVDVLPWEAAVVEANGLAWRPAPVFQLYTAYTAALDRRNAEHYAGPAAADLLLLHPDTIDNRTLAWDTPATWRAIRERYEFDRALPAQKLIVLRRGPAPRGGTLAPLREETLVPGRWFEVPRSSHPVYLELPLEPNLRGRLAGSLFRIPPVTLELALESGRVVTRRIVPDTARNGLLMAAHDDDLRGLRDLVQGVERERVASARISGPGTRYYAPAYRARWLAGSETVARRPQRQGPQP